MRIGPTLPFCAVVLCSLFPATQSKALHRTKSHFGLGLRLPSSMEAGLLEALTLLYGARGGIVSLLQALQCSG